MQNGRRMASPVFCPSQGSRRSRPKKLFLLRGSLLGGLPRAGLAARGGLFLAGPSLGRPLFRSGPLLRRLALGRLLRSALFRRGALLRRLLGGPLFRGLALRRLLGGRLLRRRLAFLRLLLRRRGGSRRRHHRHHVSHHLCFSCLSSCNCYGPSWQVSPVAPGSALISNKFEPTP